MHIERQTFRFYPNIRQRRQLGCEFGCARYAYNFGLKLRSEAFKEGKRITYNQSSAKWTEHREQTGFLKKASSAAQQQAIRHLQTA